MHAMSAGAEGGDHLVVQRAKVSEYSLLTFDCTVFDSAYICMAFLGYLDRVKT
jgi:hypothetical protein